MHVYAVARIGQTFRGGFHRGWVHPWLMVLCLAVVGVAFGLGLWLLVRASNRPAHYAAPPVMPGDPALDILRARFARGEIDADEFAARSAHLSGPVPPATPSPPGPPSA
jgi:uncharacterized membrane protein